MASDRQIAMVCFGLAALNLGVFRLFNRSWRISWKEFMKMDWTSKWLFMGVLLLVGGLLALMLVIARDRGA